MPDNSNRPREFDAVLGGEVRPPIDGVVLGGIEGVKRRLTENSFKAKYTALINAFNYEDNGLDIVIEALYNQPLSIRKVAYFLLKNNLHLEAKAVIKTFSKYQLFECIHSMDGHSYEVTGLTYISSKNILISASKDTTIKVWDLKTAQLIHTLNLSVQAWKVDFVFTSVSHDGQTLCASTERGSKIEVWNLQTGERSHILQEHSNYDSDDMSLFVISPNGKVLFSTNYDSIIKVWHRKNP